ncbi:MAG: hypothetical protein OXI43_12530 [Candidatus Poribacteria bacterium]|nr:hypothetical protein [Candidatus Poribacteria bacterium]
MAGFAIGVPLCVRALLFVVGLGRCVVAKFGIPCYERGNGRRHPVTPSVAEILPSLQNEVTEPYHIRFFCPSTPRIEKHQPPNGYQNSF